MSKLLPLALFNGVYLLGAAIYFARDLNLEFVIYVAVIIAFVVLVLGTWHYTKFPIWMLWAFSLWGLMHVLGGAVETRDGVLFAYRIYPFLDFGGDFFVLKYDQLVHFYLYGLVGVMTYHLIRLKLHTRGHSALAFWLAVLVSVGISAQNEIMEFLIAVTVERNGVGGYENAMLDLMFNTAGALLAVSIYALAADKSVIS